MKRGLFYFTVCVAVFALGLAVWPGHLQTVLSRNMLSFICAFAALAWLIAVVGAAIDDYPSRHRRAGAGVPAWGVRSIVLVAALFILLTLRVPVRLAFLVHQQAFDAFRRRQPQGEWVEFDPARRVGIYSVRECDSEDDGTVFIGTGEASGMLFTTYTDGFAYRPAGASSRGHWEDCRFRWLWGSWYVFEAYVD